MWQYQVIIAFFEMSNYCFWSSITYCPHIVYFLSHLLHFHSLTMSTTVEYFWEHFDLNLTEYRAEIVFMRVTRYFLIENIFSDNLIQSLTRISREIHLYDQCQVTMLSLRSLAFLTWRLSWSFLNCTFPFRHWEQPCI